MRALRSAKLIIVKGISFFFIASSVSVLLLAEDPALYRAILIALLVWSACRFYYFLFYVLERYVDPDFKYSGILSLITARKR
jgi:hypothetical protein